MIGVKLIALLLLIEIEKAGRPIPLSFESIQDLSPCKNAKPLVDSAESNRKTIIDSSAKEIATGKLLKGLELWAYLGTVAVHASAFSPYFIFR